MCDYKSIDDEYYQCPHPDYGPGKDGIRTFCIFHNGGEDKDAEKFYKEFKKLYKSGKHDYRGFIFPKDFDFRKLEEETGSLRFVDADFTEARFLCNVNLSGSEFSGERGVNFSWAKFSGVGGTYFNGAQFSCKGGTYFSLSNFSGEGVTDFRGANFSGEGRTDFSWAKFSCEGGTDFTGAEFSGEGVTDFSNAQFSGKGGNYFNGAEFSGEGGTNFSRAKFFGEGGTSFRMVRFLGGGDIIFHGRTFYDDSPALFRSVHFEYPEKVTFDGVDLSRCRFLRTDLSEIEFREVFWTKKRFLPFWPKKRSMVFDETFQTSFFQRLLQWTGLFSEKENDHYEVQHLYNQLRMKYEDIGRYHEAGDFFVGAMEMRKKGTREAILNRIILFFYKRISLYGERPIKALCWLVGLILIFGLIYGNLIGLVPKNNVVNPVYETGVIETMVDKYAGTGSYDNYVNGLNLSLNYLTFGKVETPHKLRYTRYGFLLQAAEVVFGAVFLSLFILAMNRKFRRMKD